MVDSLRFIHGAIDKLHDDPGVIRELKRAADAIAADIDAPSDFDVWSLAGKGPKGGFAQAGFRGDGALAVEFGSINNPPYAPVRNAVARGRR